MVLDNKVLSKLVSASNNVWAWNDGEPEASPFTTFVFIGSQSMGKSFLVERNVKFPMNVIKTERATKRPLFVHLTCDPKLEEGKPLCEVKGKKGEDWVKKEASEVLDFIESENDKVATISAEPLYLRVESSTVSSMQFVDLPGLELNPQVGEDKQVMEDIKKMIREFTQMQNTMLIVVEKATTSHTTSPIVNFMDTNEPDWKQKTILVLTFADSLYKTASQMTVVESARHAIEQWSVESGLRPILVANSPCKEKEFVGRKKNLEDQRASEQTLIEEAFPQGVPQDITQQIGFDHLVTAMNTKYTADCIRKFAEVEPKLSVLIKERVKIVKDLQRKLERVEGNERLMKIDIDDFGWNELTSSQQTVQELEKRCKLLDGEVSKSNPEKRIEVLGECFTEEGILFTKLINSPGGNIVFGGKPWKGLTMSEEMDKYKETQTWKSNDDNWKLVLRLGPEPMEEQFDNFIAEQGPISPYVAFAPLAGASAAIASFAAAPVATAASSAIAAAAPAGPLGAVVAVVGSAIATKAIKSAATGRIATAAVPAPVKGKDEKDKELLGGTAYTRMSKTFLSKLLTKLHALREDPMFTPDALDNLGGHGSGTDGHMLTDDPSTIKFQVAKYVLESVIGPAARWFLEYACCHMFHTWQVVHSIYKESPDAHMLASEPRVSNLLEQMSAKLLGGVLAKAEVGLCTMVEVLASRYVPHLGEFLCLGLSPAPEVWKTCPSSSEEEQEEEEAKMIPGGPLLRKRKRSISAEPPASSLLKRRLEHVSGRQCPLPENTVNKRDLCDAAFQYVDTISAIMIKFLELYFAKMVVTASQELFNKTGACEKVFCMVASEEATPPTRLTHSLVEEIWSSGRKEKLDEMKKVAHDLKEEKRTYDDQRVQLLDKLRTRKEALQKETLTAAKDFLDLAYTPLGSHSTEEKKMVDLCKELHKQCDIQERA